MTEPKSICEAFQMAEYELNKTLYLIHNGMKLKTKQEKQLIANFVYRHMLNYWKYIGIGQKMIQKGRDNLILPTSKL